MRFVNLAILPCERQEAKIYSAPLSFWIWGAFSILSLIELIQEIDLTNEFYGGNPIQEGYHLVIREYPAHVL